MFENKLHVCTYSSIRFTLRFVNLFVEVSRVCGVTSSERICHGESAPACRPIGLEHLHLLRSDVLISPDMQLRCLTPTNLFRSELHDPLATVGASADNFALQCRPNQAEIREKCK